MSRLSRAFVPVVLVALTLSACQKKEKVGGPGLLKGVKEQQQAKRLGEFLKSPAPTAQAGAIQNSPAPQRSPSPPPKQVLEIALVSEGGVYYKPGPAIRVSAGTTIRLINKDDKPRHFTTSDGTYDSGELKPGQAFEFVADIKGKFQVEDPKVPFATATLEVL